MYPDRDFNLGQTPPWNAETLMQDLGLDTLLDAMSRGDPFLRSVSSQAVLQTLTDPAVIRYRQEILKDCLKNPSVVKEIYQIPIEAIETKRRRWMGIHGHSPSGVLYSALQMLDMFVALLKRLRKIADQHADEFESEGFTRFFGMIKQELDDDYFALVKDHLRQLRFYGGVLLSARLGKGNEGAEYVLRRPHRHRTHWTQRLVSRRSRGYTFTIPPRDEHGARALEELRDKGINLVANAVAQSAEHINSFFNALHTEMAFYIGCMNLHERLASLGEPMSFPLPVASPERRLSFSGLYDVCLALTVGRNVVSNNLNADGKDLVVITGANQGGKTVFLRSIGLAYLMMQCGMFVGAESFCANCSTGVFTHYKREEDPTMKSGKLDEELARMSAIVDNLRSHSLMLFNESFASTNEREGSEIARQIVTALLEKRVRVFYVTHLYNFARGFYDRRLANAAFLQAERRADGTRTFRLVEGEPLQTSYGVDVYESVFGSERLTHPVTTSDPGIHP